MEFKSEKSFLNSLRGSLEVPSKVSVLEVSAGVFNERAYCSLLGAPTDQLELLTGLGLEDRAEEVKIKLKNYNGESLDHLIGKDIIVPDTVDLAFKRSGHQVVGVDLVMDVKEVI